MAKDLTYSFQITYNGKDYTNIGSTPVYSHDTHGIECVKYTLNSILKQTCEALEYDMRKDTDGIYTKVEEL